LLGQTIGIIPVLSAQGAGYLLAGLAALMALRHEQGSKTGGTDESTSAGERAGDRIGIGADGPATAPPTS